MNESKHPESEEEKSRQFREKLAKMAKARKAILEHAEGKRGVSGVLDCPVCNEGKLCYSLANNGHVHAKCVEGGSPCVCWME